MKIKHEIVLDVSRQGIQATIPITQHDTYSHQLIFRLRQGDRSVELEEGCQALLFMPNTEVYDPVTVYTKNGAFPNCLVYDVSPLASSLSGMHTAVLQVASEHTILFSPQFSFAVKSDLTSDSSLVESTPYQAVILAQTEAEASAARAEEAVESAERVLHATEEAAEQIRKDAADEAARVGEETRQTLLGIQSEIAQELDRIPTDEELAATVSSEFQRHYSTLYDMAEAAKEYTDAELAKATSVRVVSTLPTEGVANKIYLVPTGEGDQSNLYGEYLWVNRGSEDAPDFGWELIASRAIDFDLSEYAKRQYVDGTFLPLYTGDGSSAYCHTGTEQKQISFGYGPSRGTIAYRDSKGNMQVNAPIVETDCANKKYVDDTFFRKADAESLEKRIGRMESAAEGKLYTSETVNTAKTTTLTDADSILPICAIERIPLYPGQTAGSYVLDVTFPESFRGQMSDLIGRLDAAYESNPSEYIRCDVKPLEGQATVYLPSEEIEFESYTFPETVSLAPMGDGRFVYETAVTLDPAWMDCWFGTFPDLAELDGLIETEFDVVPGVSATLRVTAHSEEAAHQAEAWLSGATGDIEGHRAERELIPLDVDFSPYPTLYTEPEETLDLQNVTDCPSGVCLTVLRRTTP